MSVYAPASDYLWEVIRSYDLDPAPLFEHAGVDPRLRFDASARIARSQVNQLNQLVYQATGDDALGVRNAHRLQPGHLGALGYAWLASISLRMALEKLGRYSRLIADALVFSFEERGSEAILRFSWADEWDAPNFQRYGNMAHLVQLIRQLVGEEFTPRFVRFLATEPENLCAFEVFFRCPMSFNNAVAEIVIDRSLLDRRLPRGHAELAQVTDEMVVRYLADLNRDDVISRARAALIELMPLGEVSIEAVAERVAFSPRTLRRRLDDHGATFRSLLADLREEMALRYIRDPSLTLTEISYLLGFSEPSSFSRAYRKWTGESPTRARDRNPSLTGALSPAPGSVDGS